MRDNVWFAAYEAGVNEGMNSYDAVCSAIKSAQQHYMKPSTERLMGIARACTCGNKRPDPLDHNPACAWRVAAMEDLAQHLADHQDEEPND